MLVSNLLSKGIPMDSFSKNQLERYPIYLKYFKELEMAGVVETSSPKIAERLGYSQEQVRKDLQAISSEPGKPKKGRNVLQVIGDIESFLGYRNALKAVLVGTGHLGGALLNYPTFHEMGLEIVAGFDNDEKKVGGKIGGKTVHPLSELPNKLQELGAKIVVICVPASSAQAVCDLAVKSGAQAIWNFAPSSLVAPKNVVIENVNLASSLAVLSHRLNANILKEEAKRGLGYPHTERE